MRISVVCNYIFTAFSWSGKSLMNYLWTILGLMCNKCVNLQQLRAVSALDTILLISRKDSLIKRDKKLMTL